MRSSMSTKIGFGVSLALFSTALASCDALDSLLSVEAPSTVSADDLDNPKARPIGIVTGILLLAVLGYSLIETFAGDQLDFRAYERVAEENTNGRVQAVSDTIFGQYLVPFEMVSVLLLAALIGAIVLARRD